MRKSSDNINLDYGLLNKTLNFQTDTVQKQYQFVAGIYYLLTVAVEGGGGT